MSDLETSKILATDQIAELAGFVGMRASAFLVFDYNLLSSVSFGEGGGGGSGGGSDLCELRELNQGDELMAGRRTNGLLSALVVTLVTVLSGCAEEEPRSQGRAQYVVNVVRDECGLSEIVKDYYQTGASREGRSYSLDVLRQDDDNLLRTVHRGADWNLLDYLFADKRFEFKPNCRSDILLTSIENGVKNPNWQEFHFRADIETILCRINPAPGRDVEINTLGNVQSCISRKSGAKTFDVIHSN